MTSLKTLERLDSTEICDDDLVASIQTKPGSYENLGRLININPRSLSTSGKVDFLAALEKQYSWLYSIIQEATLALAGDEPSEARNMWEGVDEVEREDVATALNISPNTAQIRIDVARTLSCHLPAVSEALTNGEISSSHAILIARETAEALERGVSSDVIPEVESRALAHSEFHTAAQVGKKIRTLFAQYAPEIFEDRHAVSRDTRTVRIHPEGDGMSTLIALLPSEDAQTIYLAVNAIVDRMDHVEAAGGVGRSDNVGRSEKSDHSNKKNQGDFRTIEMKRADALTLMATEFLSSNKGNLGSNKRPVALNVTIDLPTLLGMANNPGELEGHGPIPASVARKLAADGEWRKFITDPLTGNLLDMGRSHYLPSQHLIDFLTARDRICRFPGCSQPTRIGDIDHAKSWESGGETKPSNLGFLCRRHHRLKTHGGWSLESYEDGSCLWTSPSGKTFFVPSRPLDQSVASKR